MRSSERERKTERKTDRQRQRDRERQRETETETERQRDRDREREKERELPRVVLKNNCSKNVHKIRSNFGEYLFCRTSAAGCVWFLYFG